MAQGRELMRLSEGWTRRFVLLFVVVVGIYAYSNRERLFLRDPLASVTRAGVREAGAQVFLNSDHDILLENDHPPMYFYVLQHGQPAGAPDQLKCIHYLLCLASGYPAPQVSALPGAQLESMTNRRVLFRDSDGREVVVMLR